MEAWDEISEAGLTSELEKKLDEFFPEIDVKKIKFVFEEETNLLNVTIIYVITELKVEDNITISLTVQPF